MIISYGNGILEKTISDNYYYYNQDMLTRGVFIVVEPPNEIIDINETTISVHYINKQMDIPLNASVYTLYWGKPLESIEVYGIISSIYQLFKDNQFEQFIFIVNKLSTQSISSSMQTNIEHSEDVLGRELELLELMIKDDEDIV